jgi:nitroreductase
MTDHEPRFANPTIDLMSSHVSVRRFTDEEVSDEAVDAILGAARRAPTSSNWQTYSIVVVREPSIKERLAEISGNQEHVVASRVFFVFCADIRRLHVVAERHGIEPLLGLQDTLVAVVDAAIAGEAAQIAVESLGLGAVMVGALRRDAVAVAEVLGLPEGVAPVYGMSVGWPADDPLEPGLKPRLPEALVVHRDRYSDEGAEALIDAYNAELAAFYERQGRNLDADAAWTGPMARRLRVVRYANLRADMEALGFRFD